MAVNLYAQSSVQIALEAKIQGVELAQQGVILLEFVLTP